MVRLGMYSENNRKLTLNLSQLTIFWAYGYKKAAWLQSLSCCFCFGFTLPACQITFRITRRFQVVAVVVVVSLIEKCCLLLVNILISNMLSATCIQGLAAL